MEKKISFCRFCFAYCGVVVDVEEGRAVRADGDKDNVLFGGFTCVKGRQLPDQHNSPQRLLHSQRRTLDGGHESLGSSQAMDEIATRLSTILREHGAMSVAAYLGTYTFIYELTSPMMLAFMQAIGSPLIFTPMTIDQSGKAIAGALHGRWGAPPQAFDDADVWMMVGINPLVSMSGTPTQNPGGGLNRALRRGLKLIVIDPRRSETAERATLHLQIAPGEDASVLAAMIKLIIEERLYDETFVEAETEGFEILKAAVAPYTPEYAATRAGIDEQLIIDAARMFARGSRGCVNSGTGTSMSAHPNLNEYLIHVLNTLCGRWLKAGERLHNPHVLLPTFDARAQALPKPSLWGNGLVLRSGCRETAAGLPTAALAEEILAPGEGRVRALINIGGNPVVAWPDPAKTVQALEALELSVSMDIKLSATARRCDFVLAPKLSLEIPGTTSLHEHEVLFTTYAHGGLPKPFAQYSPAIIAPPAESDVLEEWEFIYGIAQRMGLSLNFAGEPLDMATKPTSDEMLARLLRQSRIPLDQVKGHEHGAMFEEPTVLIRPKEVDCTERLDIGHPMMIEELEQVFAERPSHEMTPGYPYRLISRRMRHVFNSSGRDLGFLVRKQAHNPAFMHPDDMIWEGFDTGDVIEIRSMNGTILGIAEADDSVRTGTISMSHAFGDVGLESSELLAFGSTTSALSSTTRDVDPVSGMPRYSALPVSIRLHRHADSQASASA